MVLISYHVFGSQSRTLFSLNPSTRKSAVLDAITSYLVRPLYIFQGFCEKDGVRKPFGPHTPDELIQWANDNTPADLEDTRLCLDVVSNGEVISHQIGRAHV